MPLEIPQLLSFFPVSPSPPLVSVLASTCISTKKLGVLVWHLWCVVLNVQGLKPDVRKEAWKFLLGFYPYDLTDIERMELRERKEKEYWTMKSQWQAFTEDQERRFAKWREVKHLISKSFTCTTKSDLLHAVNSTHPVNLVGMELP